MLVFRSIHNLKRQLADTKNVQLCNICVENRKVLPTLAHSESLSPRLSNQSSSSLLKYRQRHMSSFTLSRRI